LSAPESKTILSFLNRKIKASQLKKQAAAAAAVTQEVNYTLAEGNSEEKFTLYNGEFALNAKKEDNNDIFYSANSTTSTTTTSPSCSTKAEGTK
jgi:hypothetical protein